MRHRSRTGIPGLAEKRWKFPAVDQLDVAPFSERDCILGKTARGHDIAAGGLLGGHDAVQLTHDGDGDLLGTPLLTLHEETFIAACEDEINAAVRGRPPFSVTVNPCCRNPSATRLSNCCHVSDATAGPLAARVLSSRRIDRDLLIYDTAAPMRKAGGTTNWKKNAPM